MRKLRRYRAGIVSHPLCALDSGLPPRRFGNRGFQLDCISSFKFPFTPQSLLTIRCRHNNYGKTGKSNIPPRLKHPWRVGRDIHHNTRILFSNPYCSFSNLLKIAA